MKVGFIGLGSMGAGMSRNLIKAGHDLVVYNRTRSHVQEMQSLGAKVADSASEAAVGAEALITMLADDRAVQDVIFEPGAAIESLPEGAVHISMSTISVDLSRKLASRTQINIRTILRLLALADRTLRLRASCSSCRRGQVNQSRNAAACLPRWGKKLS
jgi:3-hydroxyisobutyrate dehydrogenase-like beta-hydroxyacid dehydrogenase